MLKEGIAADFHRDPLGFLDREFPQGDVVQTGQNEYSLGCPIDARAVLRNADGHYLEHSDFFHTRRGDFEPRDAQLKMRRQARALLRNFIDAQSPDSLPAHLDANLHQASAWPDAGNHLAYRYLLPALLAPDSPPALGKLLDQIVERAVLAGARARQPRWRRMLLQFNTTWQLSKAIEARQALARTQPVDLLDVVAGSIEPGRRLDELVEVYLSFLFAIAGSVGFVLAWSVYLWGTHPRTVPAEWVVQEALRLWPVAWQLGRKPAQAHAVAGIDVGTTDEVVVCPYLVHRNAAYWRSSSEFQPERWAEADAWSNLAFIPFGHGPHRCVAADLSTHLVADMLRIIFDAHHVSVSAHDTRPIVAAAMAPPRFTLMRQPKG